ncbi:Leucine--tRNA ligase [Anatilimnocola aggregata]|uniref:Leucine--tRNA ligase n=1 Tax=Anatilimnocola aggregata TaxID=2528021 RepID=A0A517YJJ8_9BACT|nr:leucine--tRNA ligase [Anatilimnocola aggregata]QDU30399.1 Leucine--tRNA ligase [Anatilimnocola aggregata]
MPRYNPATIEPKWQQYWEQQQTFRVPDMPAGDKVYVLDMFPYPSGDGLHVGHPEGYTATDIVCRFERMRGKSVLHPMGFDAFGLPAEEHAIKTGEHPRKKTEENIATFTRQLRSLGFSYDWSRVLATTDVEYFRWTQWIFLELFDTWFDAEQSRGRPIAELPIPDEVKIQGERAIRLYQDDHRLAYQSFAPVNWCPKLGTVLANEEVIDGKSEVGKHPVIRMPLRQWMLRITAYADRLEKDLDQVTWPEGIKKLQRDWIGRSTGAEVDFYIGAESEFENWKGSRAATKFPRKAEADVLRIYTTRPDTLFGATYMVIAPEHPFVTHLTKPDQQHAVTAYCEKAASKSDRERQEETKKKTGVFTGSYAINPVNGQPVPIWVADYVLWGYGTGAIMAVPAHDERDFEFAQQFSLPVIAVVDPGDSEEFNRFDVLDGKICCTEMGVSVNSGQYNGLMTGEFKKRITADLFAAGLGREAVNYKLRDWLFSRQRFWGEPFPILHEIDEFDKPTGLIRAVPQADLPVDLPHLEDFKPHGKPEPPLGKAPVEWLYPEIGGQRYLRETNTMPQWAGSCWYYLRFIDPRNDQTFIDREKEKAWMPVDLYVGGAEHAVLHLLYARFWHKVLFDRGHVSTAEPFRSLVNQGMILGDVEFTGYERADGQMVSAVDVVDDDDGNAIVRVSGEGVKPKKMKAEEVEKKGDSFVLKSNPTIRIESRAFKMSKSRGNVINPDSVVKDYGADSLRLYEMFMGPLPATKPWSMAGVSGVRGFLDRVWRLMVDDRVEEQVVVSSTVQDIEPTEEQARVLHKTIKQVTSDIERMEFNTGIARMMEFTNFFTKQTVRPKSVMKSFILLLSPFAPHIAEELWELMGGQKTLAYEPWPKFDEALTKDSEIEIPIQILGKLRGKVIVPAGSDQDTILAAAQADPKISELLAGKTIVKSIVVPGKLVNFVVK